MVVMAPPNTEATKMYFLLKRSAVAPEKNPAITKGSVLAGPCANEKLAIVPIMVEM